MGAGSNLMRGDISPAEPCPGIFPSQSSESSYDVQEISLGVIAQALWDNPVLAKEKEKVKPCLATGNKRELGFGDSTWILIPKNRTEIVISIP